MRAYPTRLQMADDISLFTADDIIGIFRDFVTKTQEDDEVRRAQTLHSNKIGLSQRHCHRCILLLHKSKMPSELTSDDLAYMREIIVSYRRQLISGGWI